MGIQKAYFRMFYLYTLSFLRSRLREDWELYLWLMLLISLLYLPLTRVIESNLSGFCVFRVDGTDVPVPVNPVHRPGRCVSVRKMIVWGFCPCPWAPCGLWPSPESWLPLVVAGLARILSTLPGLGGSWSLCCSLLAQRRPWTAARSTWHWFPMASGASPPAVSLETHFWVSVRFSFPQSVIRPHKSMVLVSNLSRPREPSLLFVSPSLPTSRWSLIPATFSVLSLFIAVTLFQFFAITGVGNCCILSTGVFASCFAPASRPLPVHRTSGGWGLFGIKY